MSRNIFAQVETIRGNVDTRLNKLVNYEYDAIVLAKAGLDRLDFFDGELSQFDIKIFDIDSFVPAACQGIIAVEAKKDFKYLEYFQKISDEKTSLQYKIEREILKHLQVNCVKK